MRAGQRFKELVVVHVLPKFVAHPDVLAIVFDECSPAHVESPTHAMKVMRRQRRHHHRRLRVGSSRLRLRAGTVTTMQLDYDVEKEEGEEEEEADDGDAETADACLWSTAAKRWCALASRDLLGRLVKEGVVQIPHPQSLTTPV